IAAASAWENRRICGPPWRYAWRARCDRAHWSVPEQTKSCALAFLLQPSRPPLGFLKQAGRAPPGFAWEKVGNVSFAALQSLSGLKQANNAAVRGKLDIVGRRHPGEARHGHDVPADHHHELGAGGEPHLADRDGKAPRGALGVGIGGEAVLSLGDADRKL